VVWRYEARGGWLKILEQDSRNPRGWTFIVPSRASLRVVARAIRRLDVGEPQ
jgi:hypothetical protein